MEMQKRKILKKNLYVHLKICIINFDLQIVEVVISHDNSVSQ